MERPKVALYLRLSRDDGVDQESMSIGNQRAYLMNYVRDRGWDVAGVYADDGYTGTNFDRPDFQRLLADIEAKCVNILITKDLSRLGRDQIGTLHYIQVYFPLKGVRYIAVGEGIDTAQRGGIGIATPFLAAANDFYAADISRKVRAALDTRRAGGMFIGSSAPLGYQKDPEQKGRLIPDPERAWIVRRIFRDYLACSSVSGVAKGLTEAGVPTPSAGKGAGPTQERFQGVWSDTMVRRILKNPTYAGHLTQNRRRKLGYKIKQYETLPEEEWITIPNTHEPLISQEVFDRVQEMLRVRSYTAPGKTQHLLTGLAFCADCGAPMTYQKDGPRSYMVCQSYRKGGRLGLCSAHYMREERVIETIRQALRALTDRLEEKALEEPEYAMEEDREAVERRKGLKRQMEECKRLHSSLYRDKIAGVLTGEEFKELFEENRQRRRELEHQLDMLQNTPGPKEGQSTWQERAQKLLQFEELDREILKALVERVLVHQDKTMEIQFRFRKPKGGK